MLCICSMDCLCNIVLWFVIQLQTTKLIDCLFLNASFAYNGYIMELWTWKITRVTLGKLIFQFSGCFMSRSLLYKCISYFFFIWCFFHKSGWWLFKSCHVWALDFVANAMQYVFCPLLKVVMQLNVANISILRTLVDSWL